MKKIIFISFGILCFLLVYFVLIVSQPAVRKDILSASESPSALEVAQDYAQSKHSAAKNISAGEENPLAFLKLRATVTNSHPENSFAVILNLQTSKQKIYKPSELISGYKLCKVMRGKVILAKDNKAYFLEFSFDQTGEPIVVVSDDKRVINRQALLKKFRDINACLAFAIPVPYIEEGKVRGFKITQVKEKANPLVRLSGIQEGDVVTTVNGQQLDSMQKATEAYYKVRNQEEIILAVRRGKETKNLTYYVY